MYLCTKLIFSFTLMCLVARFHDRRLAICVLDGVCLRATKAQIARIQPKTVPVLQIQPKKDDDE